MYMYIAASNVKGPQAGSFVTQWYKKHIHFYTTARVLIPAVMLYDVKPQSLNQAEYHQITHANVH